jgi:hypothetical protein
MVEYFAEQLAGFCVTANGWVQSYGSRCVKPPIIFGDVSRPAPMTVEWIRYAQSLTDQPMKGMLTGPVTMLCWSFARDDQPDRDTCLQIALAIRDEVADLERAGIRIISIWTGATGSHPVPRPPGLPGDFVPAGDHQRLKTQHWVRPKDWPVGPAIQSQDGRIISVDFMIAKADFERGFLEPRLPRGSQAVQD